MQEIKAIIRPFKLDAVITELHKFDNLPGITISNVNGFGKSKAKNAENIIHEGLHKFIKMVKLELVVQNELVEEVINKIQKTAHTGNPGDGKIFIYDMQNIVKIRTNERGELAI